MKRRLICALLILGLLFPAGCTTASEDMYSFYYLRSEESIVYGSPDALIAPVSMEITGQSKDLNYILGLYLDGPSQENFLSPFPRGTHLVSSHSDGDSLIVTLSEEFSALEDIHLILACACLCRTCFALTDAESITIRCLSDTYTYQRGSFTFTETPAPID